MDRTLSQTSTLAPSRDRAATTDHVTHVALLGNYPPRQCGIATFTADTAASLRIASPTLALDIYAMDDGAGYRFPPEVTQAIGQDDPAAYADLADRINASGAQVLWIQHEFGIFGGEAGEHLLALTSRLAIPYVLTLHTVLDRPSSVQRRVLNALMTGAAKVIAMVERARDILVRSYDVPRSRIAVIPHGIPDRPLVPTSVGKARLGLGERPIVLTFGLLSPDKGLEDMIAALPAIRERAPDALYVVAGATHPHLVAREGDAFRDALKAQADALGVGDMVEFVNRYMELDELTDWLAAADIYVTPYRNPAQITSGTLAYAVGMGKAVVSTPFVHAAELLADDGGRLVPFRSPEALAEAVGSLLADPAELTALSRRAYSRGRATIWPRSGESALELFGTILEDKVARLPARVPAPAGSGAALAGVARLTDDTGMAQHSILAVPDRNHGYCIDDNARALMLMALAPEMDAAERARLSMVYAAFLQHGWNAEAGRFRNFMGFDRRWLEEVGSEDSNGRTLWALGVTAARHPDAAVARWAERLYDTVAPAMESVTSPRALAFLILGALSRLEVSADHAPSQALLARHGAQLMALVEANRRPDWTWFEIMLAYDNARLPEALVRAGGWLEDSAMVEAGLGTLAWIGAKQRTERGHFRPVGTASFGLAHAEPAAYDQQPLDAWAMIDACAAAAAIDPDPRWVALAERAYRWFLGDNDLGLSMLAPVTGECFDGLNPVGVNLNHGAESVLAWHLARAAKMRMDAVVADGRRRTAAAS